MKAFAVDTLRFLFGALAVVLAARASAMADEISVAVAANFTAPAKEIAKLFEADTGHTVSLSFGATGQLFAQIGQGAPFDIFLAADQAHPARAVQEGLAVTGSRFTYAAGRLVLWSANPSIVDYEGKVLTRGDFAHIAIANPETAPYGAAAMETMKAMGVGDALRPKIVMGTSVSQTYQFVVSGNVELGFIALSQLAGHDKGSSWIVPETLYTLIRQDAGLLKNAAQSGPAVAFMDFLAGPKARAVIHRYGYALPPPEVAN